MPVYNSYESVISAKSPSIWIRSNETAGTPTNSGSLACSLTAYGVPQLNYDSSVDGRSIYLNGSSGYQVSNFPSFSLLDDRSFTVETWFKSPASGFTTDFSGHFFRVDTPNSGNPGGGMGFRILGTSGIAPADRGRLELYVDFGTAPQYNLLTPLGVTYHDDKWHHAVATINTTSIKIYVDGSLVTQQTIATSTINWDSSNGIKTVGYSAVTSEFFKGQIDEFAIYDRELSPSDINANYVAGAAVYFNDIPGTASAAMVQPVLTTQTNYLATPMTASSLAGDTRVSNFNYSNLLEPYMATLTLEQWSKFDTGTTVLNYGSGGYGQWTAQGNITVGNFGLGLQGSGCLVNTTTGSSGRLESLTVEGTGGAVYSNVVNPELRDQSFVVGFWFKAANNPAAQILLAQGISDSSEERFDIKLLTSGYVSLESEDPNETKTITNSTDLADNNWHFVTAKYDDGDIQLWIDGTSVGTDSHNSVHTQDYRDFYLLKNTETFSANNEILMSQFFIGTVANIGTTQISGIYTAGSNGVIQASATMPMPVAEFKNKYNDFVISKGAIIDLRMDEASGSPINFGTTSSTFTKTGTNVTYSNATNNRFAYRLTSKDTTFEGPWSTTAGTFTTNNQQTLAVRVKIDGSATAANFIVGTAAYTNGAGIILQQMPTSNKYRLRVIRENPVSTYTFDDLQSVGSYNDNKYHHVVLTKNGTSLKIYVDGKLENSMNTAAVNLTDSGTFTIGGETTYGIPTTAAKNVYVDEVALFNYEMSAQEIFEFYQALSLEDGPGSASGELVMPAYIAGTGVSPAISPMLANTGTLPMPALSLGIGILHDHFEAFGAFVLPNYGANVNIDANYGASPLTADALLPMPQANIGDSHIAVPMNGSVLMGNATVILPGQVQASPGVANNATLVMPGIVTIKGARIFAEVLTVRAIFPLPPAYQQLTDDNYYVRLYAEHSQKTTEATQSFAAAGTATTGFTSVAKSFLKFFNDVTQDITVGSSRFLINEMPDYVYDAVGTTYVDNNGNTVAPPTTRKSIVSAAPRGSLTPTPIVSKGYFDAWDRKAVNFTNIEFNFGTDSQYHSQRQYSVEFTIKTTKSNQVLTYGNWASFYNYQSSTGTIGLFNGKLYSMETFQNIGRAGVIPHPANLDALSKAGLQTGYMLGNKRIDDGQWHHVVIQYGWTDGRTQYWIDGELDRQMIGSGSTPGSNGKNGIRPFVIGFNSNDTNLSSDFQTSVWSWTPNKFLLEQDISLNYEAAYKFSPIFAEPMLANATATPDNKAAGNRGRALMLYFWPTNTAQRGGNYSPTFDAGGEFDVPTFDPLLDTVDYIKNPPQEYEGWDVFPVDIAGYFVSDLVKVEAYGGPENILLGDGGGAVLTTGDANRAQWKFNARGTFRDALTDAPRYIDLINDIDLTQFDAIFFKNFPDQSNEIDRFAKDEVVDSYFSIRELKIYEDFIKSVRAAVDTGMSLYVTNTELAIDLGIIDRVEIVSDMNDIVGYESDVYAPTHPFNLSRSAFPISDGTTANVWKDTYKNNRFRLVNEVPGMTDFPTVILTDRLYWSNDDQIKWGGADTNLVRLVIKPNGLAVGDEWIESTYNPQINSKFYEAVPFANIKAGKPVVAFANQVRRDLDLIDNPYKNHATVIVVEPGNPLNGSLCGGKIYVNFTERLKDSVEDHGVDLIQDTWINYAESEGLLNAEEATDLRNKTYNLDRQLAAGTITQAAYNQAAYWSSNSDYILQQNTEIPDNSDTPGKGGLTKPKSQQVRKINKNGGISFSTASKGSQWFSVSFSWLYPRMTLDVPSMLTRGFWWVSNKEEPEGTVVRVLAMTASATSGQAIAVPDKIISENAEAMIANARITETFGYTPNSINNLSLPMQASALMNDKVFRVNAEPMRVAAAMTQLNRALTSSVDEVIVYIMHEDPILYLREEVIK
jgi:hypothetical protein